MIGWQDQGSNFQSLTKCSTLKSVINTNCKKFRCDFGSLILNRDPRHKYCQITIFPPSTGQATGVVPLFHDLATCNAGLTELILYRAKLETDPEWSITHLPRNTNNTYLLLHQLYWLPVEYWVKFNVLVLTFKALCGLEPTYLQDLFSQYVPQTTLCSMDHHILVVPDKKDICLASTKTKLYQL